MLLQYLPKQASVAQDSPFRITREEAEPHFLRTSPLPKALLTELEMCRNTLGTLKHPCRQGHQLLIHLRVTYNCTYKGKGAHLRAFLLKGML